MKFMTGQNPGVGPSIQNDEFVIWNRAGATVIIGGVLMLDHLAADGASLTTAAVNAEGTASGQLTWPLGNGINPATTGIGVVTDDPGAWFVVVTSLLDGAGADNTKVRACVRGLVKIDGAGATTWGDDLYPANGVRTLTTTQADGVRCLAKAVETTGGAGLVSCIFDGTSNALAAYAS